MRRLSFLCGFLFLTQAWSTPDAWAIPVFARQYNSSCTICHVGYPRLNEFGDQFKRGNYRLPQWKLDAVQTGDPTLHLPKQAPLALRVQSYIQGRQAEEVTPGAGFTGNKAAFDLQVPYLTKLLASAPLTDQLTYYMYAVVAEKGENTQIVLDDAWFGYGDLFGTGIGLQVGQFQISELMFARELRMTFQDFLAYRTAGLTYDRGLTFSTIAGPLELALGFVNGNGNVDSFNVNSPGFARPDRAFDRNSAKSGFARFAVAADPVGTLRIFGLSGLQRSATGGAAADPGVRETPKKVFGLDVSGKIGRKFYWFGQGLWNWWEGLLDAEPGRNFHWFGGFAGIDWYLTDRWALSLLYNGSESNDFRGTGSAYEGIRSSVLSTAGTYYFGRNVKAIIEGGLDFLGKESNAAFVGHLTREGYLLIGLDAAF